MTEPENQPEAPRFSDMRLPEPVMKAVREIGYEKPTPVQFAAFEPAMTGKDLVVQARTGTGKTAAFGLPMVSGRIQPEELGVQALVLCPTRELALQVERVITGLAKHTQLVVTAVYGGAPMGRQIDALASGSHIVVGTPGRVLDHLGRKTLDLSKLRMFALDECDEMLSMGFLPQIMDVWERLPEGHQTLLFSATMPKQVSRIADSRLNNPEVLALSGDHIGALEIQHFVFLSQGNRTRELLQVLDIENPESAIIFCNTRDETKRVASLLQDKGFSAAWLNADLAQADREKVMRQTREGKLRFLVCTDVASRGIDISLLTHVINYDFPDSSEQYVHRTGRTGRAGRTGTAISLVDPSAIGDLYYLRLKFGIQPVERSLPSAREERTREEADLLNVLQLRFPPLAPKDRFLSLAQRLVTHEHAESIIGGLLKSALGETDADQATRARRGALPRPPLSRRAEGRDEQGGAEPARQERRRSPSGRDAGSGDSDSRRQRSGASRPPRRKEGTAADPDQKFNATAKPAERNTDAQVEGTSRRDRSGSGRRLDAKPRRASRRTDADQQSSAPRRSNAEFDEIRYTVEDAPGNATAKGSPAEGDISEDKKRPARRKSTRRESETRSADNSATRAKTRPRRERDAPTAAAHEDALPSPTHANGAGKTKQVARKSRSVRDGGGSSNSRGAPEASDAGTTPAQPAPVQGSTRVTKARGSNPPQQRKTTPGYVNLYISVGKRDGASPAKFRNAMKAVGFSPASAGLLDIHAAHSFIEVLADAAPDAIEKLGGSEVCGRKVVVEPAAPSPR